jgi:hypothetical protein
MKSRLQLIRERNETRPDAQLRQWAEMVLLDPVDRLHVSEDHPDFGTDALLNPARNKRFTKIAVGAR